MDETGSWLERLMHVWGFSEVAGVRFWINMLLVLGWLHIAYAGTSG